jgi:hypothetical protein
MFIVMSVLQSRYLQMKVFCEFILCFFQVFTFDMHIQWNYNFNVSE